MNFWPQLGWQPLRVGFNFHLYCGSQIHDFIKFDEVISLRIKKCLTRSWALKCCTASNKHDKPVYIALATFFDHRPWPSSSAQTPNYRWFSKKIEIFDFDRVIYLSLKPVLECLYSWIRCITCGERVWSGYNVVAEFFQKKGRPPKFTEIHPMEYSDFSNFANENWNQRKCKFSNSWPTQFFLFYAGVKQPGKGHMLEIRRGVPGQRGKEIGRGLDFSSFGWVFLIREAFGGVWRRIL